MRYALFSDIHGNLEALQAVLADISNRSADRLICLGDIVGYGASPNECVEAVRASGALAIAGNHDHAATGQLDIGTFNEYATSAIRWTRQALSPESLGQWEYVLSAREAARQFESFAEAICFVGHSHDPRVYRLEDGRVQELEFPDNAPLILPGGCRHLVNVGSVGQPRDNNPQAAWALYEPDDRRLTLRRVEYPVEQAQARILETSLPAFLAGRLARGV
jgi:predicted phosphodiesterase